MYWNVNYGRLTIIFELRNWVRWRCRELMMASFICVSHFLLVLNQHGLFYKLYQFMHFCSCCNASVWPGSPILKCYIDLVQLVFLLLEKCFSLLFSQYWHFSTSPPRIKEETTPPLTIGVLSNYSENIQMQFSFIFQCKPFITFWQVKRTVKCLTQPEHFVYMICIRSQNLYCTHIKLIFCCSICRIVAPW